jgi:predicted aspartyl protease
MNGPLRSTCLIAILTLLYADPVFSQALTASVSPKVHDTQSLANPQAQLHFHLCWGYLVIVEGSIGDIQKLNFLVDTGAYPSVIDERIAHSLGLAEKLARVNLSNQSVQTKTVVLPSLVLGPIHVASVPVLSQDLSVFQKNLGYKVDAIVGLDVLKKSNFTLNYKTKLIAFGPVENLNFSAPFETETPVVTIPMESQHRHLRLVVDTGAPDLMLFQSRLPDSANFQILGTEKVIDAGGAFQCRKVQIPDVHLGKENIGLQPAFVSNDRKDVGDDFDGVLGVRGAKLWKIAFDFEHRKFSWER